MAQIRVLLLRTYMFANGLATFINNCQTRVPKGLRPHAAAEIFFVFIIHLRRYIIM